MRHPKTTRPGAALLGTVLLSLLIAACAELPALQANNVCGNGIIEPANLEDCEPGKTLPDGLVCGAALEEQGCRFICADDEGQGERIAACPVGWGCAARGVCQPPSGRFSEPRIISGITTPLAIGDFDGDDFPDIVAVQEPLVSIAYGNANTEYTVNVRAPIDSAPADPIVGDIDDDGLDDLVVYAGERVYIFTGTESRTLAPLMVPSSFFFDLPDRRMLVPVTTNADPDYEEAVLLLHDQDAQQLALQVVTHDTDDALTLPLTGGEMPSAVASADLLGQDGIHEIAVAPHRGRQVVLVSMTCAEPDDPPLELDGERVGPGCYLRESGRVQVPGDWELSDAGTFVADVNGDGQTDLLFGLQGPGGQGVAAALGDGEGGLQPAYQMPIEYDGMGPDMPVMPGAQMMMTPPPWLLAVGDIDGDDNGLADVITSSGTWLAEGGGVDAPIAYTLDYAPQRKWDAVQIVDINLDDEPDLVAVSGSSLLIHLNVGDAFFNEAETTLTGEELAATIGDFDGDIYPDVMLQVAGLVLIGFNDGRGLMEDLQEVLASGNQPTATALRSASSGNDAIDDIVLIRDEQGAAVLLELEGSGTRRLAAPFDLAAPVEHTLVLEDADGRAVGVLLEDGDDGRVFRGVDQAALLASLSTEPPPLEADADCFPQEGASLAVQTYRNRGNTGFEHAVLIESRSDGPMNAEGVWTPRVLVFDGVDTLTCTALEASPFGPPAHTVRVADIDGDGRLDLLVAHARLQQPGGDVVEGGLSVYWGDRDGGFAPSPQVVPLVAASAGANGEPAQFLGPFDAIRTTPQRGAQLVMGFETGLYMVSFDRDTREASTPARMPSQRLGAQDVGRIDALDFDLDGVTDILLSGPRQAALVLQDPCTAQEAAEGECERIVQAPEANDAD